MPGRRSIVSVRRWRRACARVSPGSPGRKTARHVRHGPSGTAPGRRQFQLAACFQYRLRVFLPVRLVQIGREEKARFIPQ